MKLEMLFEASIKKKQPALNQVHQRLRYERIINISQK